jgi:hypothetical protein
MTALVWKHGTSRDEVRRLFQSELNQSGHARSVTWNGDRFAAVVGWGSILDLQGEITDDAIVVEKSRGAIGKIVLQKIEAVFERLFPGGRQQ